MDSSFRPLRGANIPSQKKNDVDETQAQSSVTPNFQRQQSQGKSKKESVFPEWDLLPPRSVIRRKGL